MAVPLPFIHPFDLESAKALPEQIRFGTSTWTYEGWKGLIYHQKYANAKAFRGESLEEYASWPLFRTVGIDSSFYSPPEKKTLEQYSKLVPENFQWVSKAWERISIFEYPSHPRYGKEAGRRNPDFLNPNRFLEDVLPCYETVEKNCGAFVFQFARMSSNLISRDEFLARLNAFLVKLPRDFRYAIEIRNTEFLCPEYFQVLNSNTATHCFNHWNSMPSLKEQMKAAASAGGLNAPYYVARILTPLGMNYQKAVELFQPYKELQRPNLEMREDVKRLMRRAIERDVPAFVIVNNRSEGNAPMTINAISSDFMQS